MAIEMDLDAVLENFGLTKLEIKIYKMLMHEGSNSAGDISQKTAIHRRNPCLPTNY